MALLEDARRFLFLQGWFAASTLSEQRQRVWAVRQFRVVFVGLAASLMGDSLLLLVLAIWVKSLTGSNGQAGGTFLLLGLPSLLSPLGGYIIDRVPRKPFLIWVNAASALLLLPLLAVHGREDVPIIYAVALLYGVSLVLNGASLNGLLKALLPDELLADANGALQTVGQGLRLLAPLVGAGMFAAFGGAAVAALDALTFLFAAGTLLAVRINEAAVEPTAQRWWNEMTAGARHIFQRRLLRNATLAYASGWLVIGFAETVGFAVNDQGLHRSPSFVGVLVSVQGIGGVPTAVLASRVVRRLTELRTLALGLLLIAAGLATWLTTSLVLVLVGSVVLGIGLPLVAVAFSTLLQRQTPGQLMGRVSAAAELLVGGPQILSLAAGAALITIVDYRILVVVMVLVMSCAGTALLQRDRALNQRV